MISTWSFLQPIKQKKVQIAARRSTKDISSAFWPLGTIIVIALCHNSFSLCNWTFILHWRIPLLRLGDRRCLFYFTLSLIIQR